VLTDLEALVPSTVMCILFIALIRTILRAQNPQRREENKRREAAAEAADPRIDTSRPTLIEADQPRKVRSKIQ
jgi:hypothetical protein